MSALEQVLVVSLNDSRYAIETDYIQHILRVPEITQIPMAPDCIRGICSLEGGIITVFDGKKLIDKASTFVDIDEYKSRMLTMRNGNQSFSILVDEVVDNISPNPENIEKSKNSDKPVEQLIKLENEIIQVLSVEKLTKDISLSQFHKSAIKDVSTKDGKAVESDNNSQRYLFFKMGNESFALNIETIREIISQRDITPIADSSEEIMGMFTLRDNVLVSIDLRAVFKMEREFSDKNRTIVIQNGNNAIGLLVDNIIDIKDVCQSKIDKIPQHFEDEKISGVVHINKELISIISNSVLNDLIESAKATVDKTHYSLEESEEEKSKGLEVVIFSINNKEYGFNIEEVEEIIRYSEITTVPDSDELLKGIINLRGEIIPIVSLQKRMGIEERIDEDTKILVCKVHNKKLGFLVDNVNQVLDVSSESIQENDSEDALFKKVILLEDGERIVLEISTAHILNEDDMEKLSSSVKGK